MFIQFYIMKFYVIDENRTYAKHSPGGRGGGGGRRPYVYVRRRTYVRAVYGRTDVRVQREENRKSYLCEALPEDAPCKRFGAVFSVLANVCSYSDIVSHAIGYSITPKHVPMECLDIMSAVGENSSQFRMTKRQQIEKLSPQIRGDILQEIPVLKT